MTFKKTSLIVLIWQIAILVIGIIAPLIVSYQPSFPYFDEILTKYGPRWLHSWANFDGVHYLTIIKKGYIGTGLIQAFFPLYPLLIKHLSFNTVINPIIVSKIISIVSLSVTLYFLNKLIILDEEKRIARKTIYLLLLFPTSFFFTAFYTESIFLMFVVLSFYFSRKGNWLKAGIMAALASATRVTGIVLLPALLLEYFQQRKKNTTPINDIIPILSISASGLGILSYMKYLKKYFSDPLLFLHVQEQFGVGRQSDKLVMLYQVFYRYIKMILTVQKDSLLFYIVSLEFLVGVLFLILLILAFKHTRKSYALFGILSYIIPTLTGTLTSMPRYVLVLFPAFIVLAKLLKEKKYLIFLSFSGILLFVNTILFIQGRWVS